MGGMTEVKGVIKEDKVKILIKVLLPFIVSFLFSCVVCGQVEVLTSEETVIDLGKIGVVSASFRPESAFQKPMTRWKAAAQGAGFGAIVPIAVGFECGGPGGAIYGIFLTPVGALIGSIVGVATGESSEKLKNTEDSLNNYLATRNLQEEMRAFLLSLAREQIRNPFVALEVQGPGTPYEEIIYDTLSGSVADTVLEIGVLRCDLNGVKDAMNPDLHLTVDTYTRFISVKDGKVLDSPSFRYESDNHKFSDWGADNARLFKEGLDSALQFLAGRIIEVVSIMQKPLDSQPSEEMDIE
jgi:hypothetical protein